MGKPLPVNLYFSFLVSLLFFSCSSQKTVLNTTPIEYNCLKVYDFEKNVHKDSLQLLAEREVLVNTSYKDLLIANAFGLLDELKQLYEVRKKLSIIPDNKDLQLEELKLENNIDKILIKADLELTGVSNYIDCNILQLRKFVFELEKRNNKSQNNLSNWAIITGAAATVLTAGILVSDNETLIGSSLFDWTAIGTGVITTYLAIQSNKVDKKVLLKPSINMISAVFNGKNNQEFPDNVWYLLNSYMFVEQNKTIRKSILENWYFSPNLLADPSNYEAFPLLLEEENEYTVDMLKLRIELLETINLGIDQITRQLLLFER